MAETSPAHVAVATRGGGLVNQHFGHAAEFLVYRVTGDGAELLGVRRVEHYCQGGDGEDGALEAILRALAGCQAVLVAKIGRCPAGQLEAAGIAPVTEHAFQPIPAALRAWYHGRVEAAAVAGVEVARAEVA
jgi:nitrogen fixation protein NifB